MKIIRRGLELDIGLNLLEKQAGKEKWVERKYRLDELVFKYYSGITKLVEFMNKNREYFIKDKQIKTEVESGNYRF